VLVPHAYVNTTLLFVLQGSSASSLLPFSTVRGPWGTPYSRTLFYFCGRFRSVRGRYLCFLLPAWRLTIDSAGKTLDPKWH